MPDPFKQSVSSSQASALFDANPYYTKFVLWHFFRGDGIDLDPGYSERIEWGVLLQSAILKATSKAYRLDVIENTANEYRRVGSLGATIDGLMMAPDAGPILVEAKNIDWLRWRDTWTRTAAAPHVEIQTQIGIKAAGATRGIIAALVGGNDLRFYERERDDDMLAQLEAAAEEFLASVRDGREPAPFGDASELPALAKLYPETDPKLVVEDYEDLELAYAIRRYQAADEECKSLKRETDQLKAKILARAAGAAEIRANGWACDIRRSPIAAQICEPHDEPKQLRKPSVQTVVTVRKTQEVEIAVKEGPEMMA